MKKIILCFLLFQVFCFHGQQNKSYIDSINYVILKFPRKQQLKIILETSYGNIVSEINQSEKLLKKGEKLAFDLKDNISLADIFIKQSIIYAYKNELNKSVELKFKAIRIYEIENNISKLGYAYGELGYSIKKKNITNAIKYMRKGLLLLEESKDLKAINPVYDNYGTLLLNVKKIDSALYYQYKSLLIKKQLKDSVGLGYSYVNIGNSYAEKNDLNTAKIYLDSSVVIRNKIGDNYGSTVNKVQIADLFLLQKKYDESILNYKSALIDSKKYNYKDIEQYCYENLYLCYKNQNDSKNAIFFLEKYQAIKDSSNSIITNTNIEKLQIQFETEKKEKQLAIAKSENLLKEAKIKKRTTFLYSALGLALLLGLIGYLVYKQQRLKNSQIIKENDLIQALIRIENQNNLQEQRLAISEDLHDNIGSQLTFIISSLDNLKYFEFSKDKLYSKFDAIESFTRATITDLRDTIWAMNKEEITFEDLKTRITNFIETAKISLRGIQFDFNYDQVSNPVELDAIKGIDVYRIIQESVNNAIKHAEATKISVNFIIQNNQVIINIIDNGNGIDLQKITDGNGMISMKKRANEIGANLAISTLEKGTKVSLELALN